MTDEAEGSAQESADNDGRLSAEADFMLIWGIAAALLTGLYALGGGLATAVLLGSIATAASFVAVVADLSRSGFRPSSGLYGVVTLSAAAGALIAYVYDGALITASGLGVIAVANAGRVFEVDHRDEDSLLDPLTEDEDDELASDSENTE
jgi:hypothetical protein